LPRLYPEVKSAGARNFSLADGGGVGIRLPSGTTTRFYWGDDPSYAQIKDYGWYDGNSGGKTHEVGAKLPNKFGLFDMSGNVYELCQDWYGKYSLALILIRQVQ
jgi:hypothetical protein